MSLMKDGGAKTYLDCFEIRGHDERYKKAKTAVETTQELDG